MKKSFILALLFFLLNNQIEAQKIKFGVGPVIMTPLGGHLSDINKFGFGAEIDVVYKLAKQTELFSQLGVNRIYGKPLSNSNNQGFKSSNLDHLKFLIGARHKIGNIFGGIGIGYASFTSYETGFSYSPQLGYRYKSIDFILDYTSTKVESWNFSTTGISAIFHKKN